MASSDNCKLRKIFFRGPSRNSLRVQEIDESCTVDVQPIQRYGHNAVGMNDHVILFGGLARNDSKENNQTHVSFMSHRVIWLLNMSRNTWTTKCVIPTNTYPTEDIWHLQQ